MNFLKKYPDKSEFVTDAYREALGALADIQDDESSPDLVYRLMYNLDRISVLLAQEIGDTKRLLAQYPRLEEHLEGVPR